METHYGSLGSVEEFAKTGYSQDGYESILNFVEWKKDNLSSSRASDMTCDIENIMTIDGFQCGTISLEDLKAMVSLMEERGIDKCEFEHEIEDGCLEKAILKIDKVTERKITQEEWMVKYSEYVKRQIMKNVRKSNNYLRTSKIQDSQYQTYLKLKEKFEL